MPFASRAQQRLMFAVPSKIGGLKKVREWAHKTDFSYLPERAPSQKGKPHIKMPRRRTQAKHWSQGH